MSFRISTPPSLMAQLVGASDKLDRLMAELSLGINGQGHFDALEEKSEAIAAAIRAAFRAGAQSPRLKPGSFGDLRITRRDAA